MNKKRLNIVLLVLMAIIWGLVGRRLFLNANATASDVVTAQVQPTATYKTIAKDTFKLEHLERDPFLGVVRNYTIASTKSSKKSNQTAPNKKEKAVIKWPTVNYYGLVKKASSKQPLALLKINNITHYAKAKDVIEEVTVLKVTRDSIALQFEKEKKYIKKQ